MTAARPQLKPALRRVWRDATTLQLGVDPRQAVVISGLDQGCARLVEALDGTRDRNDVLNTAHRLGIEPARADELLRLLERSGVLDDASTDRRALAALSQRDRDRAGECCAGPAPTGEQRGWQRRPGSRPRLRYSARPV